MICSHSRRNSLHKPCLRSNFNPAARLNMKTLLVLLLVGLGFPAFGATTNSELSLSIAVPYASNRLAAFGKFSDTNDTRVLCSTWDNHFPVVLRNISDKPVNIWQQDNSWGYYDLSFELRDGSGKTWVARKVTTAFHSNGPMFWTLKPNETLVIDVCFTNDQKSDWQKWNGFPRNQTVSMRAVFAIHKDASTKKYSVWTGRVVSAWNRYFFVNPTGL